MKILSQLYKRCLAQSKRDDFLQKRRVFWSSQACLESRFIEPKSVSLFTFAGRMMWDLLIGTVLFGPFSSLINAIKGSEITGKFKW